MGPPGRTPSRRRLRAGASCDPLLSPGCVCRAECPKLFFGPFTFSATRRVVTIGPRGRPERRPSCALLLAILVLVLHPDRLRSRAGRRRWRPRGDQGRRFDEARPALALSGRARRRALQGHASELSEERRTAEGRRPVLNQRQIVIVLGARQGPRRR